MQLKMCSGHFLRVKGEGQPPSNHVGPWIWSEKMSESRTKAGIWQYILRVVLEKLKHREGMAKVLDFWGSQSCISWNFPSWKVHDKVMTPVESPSPPALCFSISAWILFTPLSPLPTRWPSARVAIFSFHLM